MIERRGFLQSAGVGAVGVSAAAEALPAIANAAAAPVAGVDRWAHRAPKGEPQIRRWNEQKWILDNIIQANGLDWDQSRTGGMIRACGPAIADDMAAAKAQVKRLVDIPTAFELIGIKREGLARTAEAAGNTVDARDNYFMAAQCFAQAMWSMYENSARLLEINRKKRETYTKYMQYADHHVEYVEIPYRGKNLPAVFHLPPGYVPGTKIPAIVAVPGMDGYKEKYVALKDDPLMTRGIAVFSIEGPGYWEAPVRGLYVDVPGWHEVGKTVMNWLVSRPEIDAKKVGMTGSSYGSFFSVMMLAAEPRYACCSVTGTCYEPGGETIFNSASITFKKRFMYMSGITSEAEFDEFRKTIDWRGYAERVRTPYLVLAGDADQLCPTTYTRAFVKALGGPKQLVLYRDGDHGIGGTTASKIGPEPRKYQLEWTLARLEGKPLASEEWYVDVDGKITKKHLA